MSVSKNQCVVDCGTDGIIMVVREGDAYVPVADGGKRLTCEDRLAFAKCVRDGLDIFISRSESACEVEA